MNIKLWKRDQKLSSSFVERESRGPSKNKRKQKSTIHKSILSNFWIDIELHGSSKSIRNAFTQVNSSDIHADVNNVNLSNYFQKSLLLVKLLPLTACNISGERGWERVMPLIMTQPAEIMTKQKKKLTIRQKEKAKLQSCEHAERKSNNTKSFAVGLRWARKRKRQAEKRREDENVSL